MDYEEVSRQQAQELIARYQSNLRFNQPPVSLMSDDSWAQEEQGIRWPDDQPVSPITDSSGPWVDDPWAPNDSSGQSAATSAPLPPPSGLTLATPGDNRYYQSSVPPPAVKTSFSTQRTAPNVSESGSLRTDKRPKHRRASHEHQHGDVASLRRRNAVRRVAPSVQMTLDAVVDPQYRHTPPSTASGRGTNLPYGSTGLHQAGRTPHTPSQPSFSGGVGFQTYTNHANDFGPGASQGNSYGIPSSDSLALQLGQLTLQPADAPHPYTSPHPVTISQYDVGQTPDHPRAAYSSYQDTASAHTQGNRTLKHLPWLGRSGCKTTHSWKEGGEWLKRWSTEKGYNDGPADGSMPAEAPLGVAPRDRTADPTSEQEGRDNAVEVLASQEQSWFLNGDEVLESEVAKMEAQRQCALNQGNSHPQLQNPFRDPSDWAAPERGAEPGSGASAVQTDGYGKQSSTRGSGRRHHGQRQDRERSGHGHHGQRRSRATEEHGWGSAVKKFLSK